MKANLKSLALAVFASLTFAVSAAECLCEPMVDAPTPAAEAASAQPAPETKRAQTRRTRRAKKEKATAPAGGTQKQPRRRRTRKSQMSALPVTGMLDSAE